MGAGRSMRGNDYYHDADREFRGYDRSRNFGAHARGDMSGGTRYGEGGSTYGGGSAYGHSDYGYSNRQHHQDYDRNRDNDRYRTGGSEDYIDYSSRNYGSFGGSREEDYHSRGHYNTGGRGRDRNDNYSYGQNSYDRSSGYDRSYRGMPQGYGSTGYNERDRDRERSTYRDYNDRDNYSRNRHRNDEERYR